MGWQVKIEQAEAGRKALAEEIEQIEVAGDQARTEVAAMPDRVAVERDQASAVAASARRPWLGSVPGPISRRPVPRLSKGSMTDSERDRLLAERDEAARGDPQAEDPTSQTCHSRWRS